MGALLPNAIQMAENIDENIDGLLFRQLTHQTKNSMQRIMNELSRSSAFLGCHEWKRMIDDLQQRVMLSARLPDLLFGPLSESESLEGRLMAMGETLIALLGNEDQVIDFKVSVLGSVPRSLQPALLRLAHEMVGNAVKHGMRERVTGRIWVRVKRDADLTLCVDNDGWFLPHDLRPGEGMALMRQLAGTINGRVSIGRSQEITQARMVANLA